MSDGSNLGINAERALGTILGGEPTPGEDEKLTPEQVRARIETATANSYGGSTDCMTRAVLRLFEANPVAKSWPTEHPSGWILPDGTLLSDEAARDAWQRAHGPDYVDSETGAKFGRLEGPDLYEEAKRVATDEETSAFEGCTGFMWGFAVNQARWLVGAVIGGNPAVITIGETP